MKTCISYGNYSLSQLCVAQTLREVHLLYPVKDVTGVVVRLGIEEA